MSSNAVHASLKSVLKLIEVQTLRSAADAELLQRFVTSHDEAAFRVIAERHGPMVLGVCQRALDCPHDAEDAFQATFLVFARSASSIRRTQSLGSWLHGVASRVSGKLRRDQVRRQQRERSRLPRESTEPVDALTWAEVKTGLDEELQRLPKHFQDVLVCCYLEGKTRDEAAQQLGLTCGVLHGRLERGRKLLADRMTARGLTLGAGLLVLAVSPSTVLATVRAAALYAASQSVADVVSPVVVSLTQEVLKGMIMSKVKLVGTSVLASLVLVTGVGFGLAQEKAPPENVAYSEAGYRLTMNIGIEKPVTDEEFIRRLSLDLRGTTPTPTEVHFFKSSKEPKKRERLTDLFIQEREAQKKAKEEQRAKAVNALLQLANVQGRSERENLTIHHPITVHPRPVLYEGLLQSVFSILSPEAELLNTRVELAKLSLREKELLLSAAQAKKPAPKPEEIERLKLDVNRAKLAIREAELNREAATLKEKTKSAEATPKEKPKAK
jgi:RNA polymerase sigma factor (sigma-70 family)